MRFLKDGPDIPERLLEAHDDGKVVFFCGAGISKPAGVPLFGELVESMAHELYHDLDEIQATALDAGEYDRVVHLLEHSLQGGRELVRSTLPRLLRPQRLDDDSLSAHRALLSLSTSGRGSGKLVTTNFDRLFEAAAPDGVNIASLCPKDLEGCCGESARGTRATSDVELVYLHGRLPDAPAKNLLDDDLDEELARLILSSGDFGRAYLLQSWASRFLGELFKEHTVCFVGYSLNDPIVRYFTDALAIAEEAPTGGKNAPFELFAFEGCHQSDADRRALEWAAKGATLIPYDPDMGHIALRQTLSEWARCREVGEDWKSALVRNALKELDGTFDPESHLVEHVTYAIRAPSGRPMATFANWEPTPSLDWFKVVTGTALPATTAAAREHRSQKRTTPKAPKPENPYSEASPASLTIAEGGLSAAATLANALDQARFDWVLKHIGDERVLLVLYEQVSPVPNALQERIRSELPRIVSSGQQGRVEPEYLHRLWHHFLEGNITSVTDEERYEEPVDLDNLDIEEIARQIPTLLEVRSKLHMYPIPGEPYFEAQCTLIFVMREGWRALTKYLYNAADQAAHAELHPSVSAALERAFELHNNTANLRALSPGQSVPRCMRENEAGWLRSAPMVSLSEYAALTLKAVALCDTERGKSEIEHSVGRANTPFQRIGLYILEQLVRAAPETWLSLAQQLLLNTSEDTLWSRYCEGETLPLLRATYSGSKTKWREEMEAVLLRGYPAVLHGNVDETKIEYSEWLRFANIAEGSSALALDASRDRLSDLVEKHPQYRLDPTGTRSTHLDENTRRHQISALRQLNLPTPVEVASWLRDPPEHGLETWNWYYFVASNLSRAAEFVHTHFKLSRRPRTPEFLEITFRALSEAMEAQSHPLLQTLDIVASQPDEKLWVAIGTLAEVLHEALLVEQLSAEQIRPLATRFAGVVAKGNAPEGVSAEEALEKAAKLLITLIVRGPSDQADSEQAFSLLNGFLRYECDYLRPARHEIARNAARLSNVNSGWSQDRLRVLFDWKAEHGEAASAWNAFFEGSQETAGVPVSLSFLLAAKQSYLECARHSSRLAKSEAYATTLVACALAPQSLLALEEIRMALQELNAAAITNACREASRRLDIQDYDIRRRLWSEQLKPLFLVGWPKSKASHSRESAHVLAELCLKVHQCHFSSAVEVLERWLTPPIGSEPMSFRKPAPALLEKSPEASLRFLYARHRNGIAHRFRSTLANVLACIEEAAPALRETTHFQALLRLASSGPA